MLQYNVVYLLYLDRISLMLVLMLRKILVPAFFQNYDRSLL